VRREGRTTRRDETKGESRGEKGCRRPGGRGRGRGTAGEYTWGEGRGRGGGGAAAAAAEKNARV